MDFIIVIAIIAIPIIAQSFISFNYNKFKQIINKKELSGCEIARQILDENGLDKVHVVEVKGIMSDHYDPNRKVVRLSTEVFHGTTIASSAIAAHECGHAIQDKEGYSFMRFRSMIYPVVRISNYFSYIIIVIGLIMEAVNLFLLGIALVSLGLLFQLVTLPVEFNASARAKKELEKLKLVNKSEYEGVSKMLNSAAMTYVAGVISNILDLIRLLVIANDKRD